MSQNARSARHDLTARLFAAGVIAVIRMAETARLLRAVEAVRTGGGETVEITRTGPGAQSLIRAARDEVGPDALRDQAAIGAGDDPVLTEEARRLVASVRASQEEKP